MLAAELEKDRREHPEELHEQFGACRFCGQVRRLETFIAWPESECNEVTTELCGCYEAIEYTRKKSKLEKTKAAIQEKFGEESGMTFHGQDKVLELMNMMAEQMVEDNIQRCSVDISGQVKAKFSFTSKGAIKVERTITRKEAEEI